MQTLNLKKIFLYLLICSIALSALMGIWAILSQEFGSLQERVLATTLTVVGTSILGLACGAFLESPHSRGKPLFIVPLAGIILAVLCALLTVWLIWGDVRWEFKGFYKTLFVSLIFSFALAQLSLLSLARLAKRFRWAIVTAYIVVLALASIISLLIVFEPPSDDGFVMRALGVLGVIDAAMTVMIPVFHRLSRTEFVDVETPSVDKIDAEIDNLKSQIAQLEKQREDILRAEEKNQNSA
jgi:hypothetical protein